MQNPGELIRETINIFGVSFEYNPVTVVMTLVTMAVIIVSVVILKRGSGIYPRRGQCLLEAILLWFGGILKDSMGEDGEKFLPFIVTLFLFILVANWLNVIPGLSSPTKDLNTCLGLGLVVFFVSHINAIKTKGLLKYIKSYFEPFWFLFPSNVFSEASKVLSHSFRLFGNIFAGGVVISLLPFLLYGGYAQI